MLVVDVVGSVPLMARHDDDTVRRWREFAHEVRNDVLPLHGATLVKSLGDGFRILADDAAQALRVALDLHRRVAASNDGLDGAQRLMLHAGVHVADVVVDDLDVYGHGVNVAARLAQHSSPGDTLLSVEAHEQLVPGLDPAGEDLGDLFLKGLPDPLRTYRVSAPGPLSNEALIADESSSVVRPTLAVLPFADGARDQARLPVGELLADELICALSALPELQVVSRLSTSALARRGFDAVTAAPAVKADYVLTGTCTRVGRRLLVHAELFDARRAEVLRQFRETATLGSLVDAESPIVHSLVEQVCRALLERQIDLARRCALPNLAGYTLLLGGIALMHRLSRRDVERAGQLLRQLTERWPRLAAPHAWLARLHLLSALQQIGPDPAADRTAAHASSERALDLDPESSVALAVAGSVRVGLSHDVDGALALYDRAVTYNPSDSFAWMLHGTAHAFRGAGADAVRASAQAQRLSPLDPMRFMYDCHAAAAALAADDAERARALAQRSLAANAQHLSTLRVLAIAQVLCGDVPAARETVRRLRVLSPSASVDGYLRSSPSANYEIGRRFARLLGEAGLPQTVS